MNVKLGLCKLLSSTQKQSEEQFKHVTVNLSGCMSVFMNLLIKFSSPCMLLLHHDKNMDLHKFTLTLLYPIDFVLSNVK